MTATIVARVDKKTTCFLLLCVYSASGEFHSRSWNHHYRLKFFGIYYVHAVAMALTTSIMEKDSWERHSKELTIESRKIPVGMPFK